MLRDEELASRTNVQYPPCNDRYAPSVRIDRASQPGPLTRERTCRALAGLLWSTPASGSEQLSRVELPAVGFTLEAATEASCGNAISGISDTLFRDDPELLGRFRQGNPAALATVYRHYSGQVNRQLRRMAYRMSASEFAQESTVADLVHEVFIRVFAHAVRERGDFSEGLRPYLHVLARHCLVDALRKRRREVLVPLPELQQESAAHVDPWTDAPDPIVATVVVSYLAKLPPSVWAVYEQRYILGRSQHETGKALDASRRQVRTLEDRLRRGLRQALGLAPTQSARVASHQNKETTT